MSAGLNVILEGDSHEAIYYFIQQTDRATIRLVSLQVSASPTRATIKKQLLSWRYHLRPTGLYVSDLAIFFLLWGSQTAEVYSS